MKKLVAMMLTAVMVLGLTACSNNDTTGAENESNVESSVVDESTEESQVEESTEESQAEESTEAGDAASDDAVIIAPELVDADTFGGMMWDAFLAEMKENPEAAPIDVANVLIANEAIQFMGGTVEMEPGWFMGFTNDVTGFDKAAQFGPMMTGVAFMGYIFTLEEGADVNAFMTSLAGNADPRWNICVEADQTVIGAYDNTVFFLMCPLSNEAE